MYKGRYFDSLVLFLKDQDPDFISIQEVTTGKANLYRGNENLFEKLKDELGLNGAFNTDYDLTNNEGGMGNAVLTKHEIVSSIVVPLLPHQTVSFETSNDYKFWPRGPRHLLAAEVRVGPLTISIMSTHGAWTAPPEDTDETVRQAGMTAEYLKNLNQPFILGGDFNALIQSKTIGTINKVANNLLLNSGVIETTNPQIHKIKPRGYLIDFIFTSPEFKLERLLVPQITVSDHLPVIAELQV